MVTVISILSPGAMGSAVGVRLVAHGATVLTSLEGRSAASVARALAAGMKDAPSDRLVEADFLLSIVPPGEAEALARRLAPALVAAARKPVYIDCNALSPDTKRSVAGIVAATGAKMLDAAIIGTPPVPGTKGPALYVSGDPAGAARPLAALGIDLRPLSGPIGAAAALKMSFAGINKGSIGVAAAMMLAASRAGAGEALHAELAASLGEQLAGFEQSVPRMYPKAYRWVAEMREIAAFAGDDAATAMIFEGLAQLFERLAADDAGNRREQAMLDAFLKR